jgi:hypothetical protein
MTDGEVTGAVTAAGMLGPTADPCNNRRARHLPTILDGHGAGAK